MPCCAAPDCLRWAAKGRGGMCEPCYRNQHRARLRAVPARGMRYESPRERAIEAFRALMDTPAEDDEAWERNIRRAFMAARDWVTKG